MITNKKVKVQEKTDFSAWLSRAPLHLCVFPLLRVSSYVHSNAAKEVPIHTTQKERCESNYHIRAGAHNGSLMMK